MFKLEIDSDLEDECELVEVRDKPKSKVVLHN
jgi:hypothetical protein